MVKLKLEHLHKAYHQIDAIKDINLEIQDQEFIVIVGPSGCGKSTLLRLLAGLEEHSRGQIIMDGQCINHLSPKERNVSFVFQNFALYPHMNVYHNLAFGLKSRKTPKEEIERRIQNIAKLLHIEDLLKRKPKELSGGQLQRIAIGRAIIRDANLLLMDEPLSNLDAQLRTKMRKELIQLHQQLKTTTLYVTHDQAEAMTMATRLVVMNQGIIQQIGTPQEVYNRPKNVFVAGFIGSPGMNFFNGILNNGKIQIGSLSIPLLESQLTLLEDYNYQEIIIGIRPEDFSFNPKRGISFHAKAEVIESLGAEILVHFELDGQPFTARLKPTANIQVGHPLTLSMDLEKLHFFESHTKNRIF
ncbi:sn-glycerol-3-phosphate ABC transporter ATP-binding protein UgpC [Ureibacillus sp. FSL K6-3587]|uniref:ABC transporter ATP-binding protein n=1 Tax=Ureibacillus sp. FSL K6-3587 TaxID=2954681 RepID=UPI003158B0BF